MIPVKIYPYLLILLVTLWPLFLLFTPMPLYKILILITLSIALLTLVWNFCTSKDTSFVNGLAVISATMTSGCANITILYLLPFLVVVYLICIFQSVVGLVRGRHYTQAQWIKFTDKYYAILSNRMKKQ
jgi:hypothetical protein